MPCLFPWGWTFIKSIGPWAHPGSRVESHLYCSPIKVGSKIQNRPNVSPALNLSGRDFSTSPRLLYITFFPKIYIDWIPWVYIGLWILLLWNYIRSPVVRTLHQITAHQYFCQYIEPTKFWPLQKLCALICLLTQEKENLAKVTLKAKEGHIYVFPP